ncbi:MAG: PASTA domain-containing protein [Candidatus Cloacimonetes bacterium]|nr:PASTA domain-containing protein [Candidatus Cloacimonadota bacterium]
MKKIKAFLISALIMIGVFVIGFFGINIFMKFYVGHRNEVKTPKIIDQQIDVAIKKCKSLDLYLQEIDFIHSDEIPKDRIISQDPHPEIMTKKYNTIKVVVSKGPEQVRIPFLDNLELDEAKLRLENAGLLLGKKIFRYSNEVKKSKIMYSQPMAEEMIPKGSEIDVVISLGKLTGSKKNIKKYKNLLDELDE